MVVFASIWVILKLIISSYGTITILNSVNHNFEVGQDLKVD